MEKIELKSADIIKSNIEKLGRLFPSCITERKSLDGQVERIVDFNKLRIELSQDFDGGGRSVISLLGLIKTNTLI